MNLEKIKDDLRDSIPFNQIVDVLFHLGRAEGENETKKAFGGCTKCYGKGYATTIINQVQHADFEGDETVVTELDRIRPCSCDRGKQITVLLNKHT